MKTRPFISVVLAVRNESFFIRSALLCVLNQDYPAENYEVIAADGMSSDGTLEIIKEFQKKYLNFKLIENPKKIVSAGLNELFKKTRGKIIVRVDGHCEIPADYLSRAVELLEKFPEVAGVGGPIETVGKDFISKAVAAAMSSKFGVGGSAFRTSKDKERYVDTIPFPAYRREVIEKAGLYDEELIRNQDDEYNYRLRKMGFKLLLSPEMKSRYYSRASIRRLFSQYFQYGFWKVRVLQKHPAQMQPRQFVPFLFVLALLVFLVLSFSGIWVNKVSSFLLLIYGTLNLAASFNESRKSGWSYLFILPLIYGVLHLSYGLGFFTGLIKFSNRWNSNGS